jgi:predicted PhzF superfamily epimerase YddE/YHI9
MPTDAAERVPGEWRMAAFPVPGADTGGNPAGVVLDPPDLDDEEMTRTAVRLNPLSETAFVRPPATSGSAPYRLRYFAPGGEVALCGHATAAAFGALALGGRLGELPADVASTAPGGGVQGRVERTGTASSCGWTCPSPDAWTSRWTWRPSRRPWGCRTR